MSHAWGPETTSKPLLFWRTSIFETRIKQLTHHMGGHQNLGKEFGRTIWEDNLGVMKESLMSVHQETVVMEKAGQWCLSHKISVIIWNCPYFR